MKIMPQIIRHTKSDLNIQIIQYFKSPVDIRGSDMTMKFNSPTLPPNPPPPLLLSPSPGAGAPAWRPDERDPGSEKLLAQQDSGFPEKFRLLLFLLQLHVPDPVLPKGGSRLDDRPPPRLYPLWNAVESRGTQVEETSSGECSIPF